MAGALTRLFPCACLLDGGSASTAVCIHTAETEKSSAYASASAAYKQHVHRHTEENWEPTQAQGRLQRCY